MAHFTMEFGEVLQLAGGSVVFAGEGDAENTEVVGGLFENIFTNYPIFDEAYRPRLNGLIIDRYYNQEIGHETVEKFKLQFRAMLNEIMPTYNKLYVANQQIVDPLRTIDIKTMSTNSGTQTQNTTGTSETETSTNSGSRSVYSDLPQTMLAGNEDYASNATDANAGTSVTGVGEETGNAETETEQTGETHTYGYQGSPAELLAAFRESFSNIDMLLLDELQPLFMMVWHSGDTFTGIERPYYAI